MKRSVAVAITAAAIVIALVVVITQRESGSPTTKTNPNATPAELDAALPHELPASLFPSVTGSEITESGGGTTIVVRLAPAEDDRVTILVLADKLRNRGWNVVPTTDAGHHTVDGYGWTGDLRVRPNNGGVTVTLRSPS